MAERLGSPNEKVDLLGQHSVNVLTKSTQRQSHNEKRSERRASTERVVSDVDNEVNNTELFLCICILQMITSWWFWSVNKLR